MSTNQKPEQSLWENVHQAEQNIHSAEFVHSGKPVFRISVHNPLRPGQIQRRLNGQDDRPYRGAYNPELHGGRVRSEHGILRPCDNLHTRVVFLRRARRKGGARERQNLPVRQGIRLNRRQRFVRDSAVPADVLSDTPTLRYALRNVDKAAAQYRLADRVHIHALRGHTAGAL